MTRHAGWGAAFAAMGLGIGGCSSNVVDSPTSHGPPISHGPPTSFACSKTATLKLAPATSIASVPDLSTTSGVASALVTTEVTSEAVPFGTALDIGGSGFGDGNGGEYLSIGRGTHERRIAAGCVNGPTASKCGISWSDSAITFTLPIGAEGEVRVVTPAGSVVAGNVASTWHASAMLRQDPIADVDTADTGSRLGALFASLVTTDRTYALFGITTNGAVDASHLMLVTFTDDAVEEAPLAIDFSSYAQFVENLDGSVDLLAVPIAAPAGALARYHITGETIEVDDACVPGEYGIAAGIENGNLYVWTALPTRGTVRLSLDAGSDVWSIDRGPFLDEDTGIGGHGVVDADGAVGFAWAQPTGGPLDDKGIARVAILAPGTTSFTKEDRTGPIDDSVTVSIFPTGAGFSVGYCNYDETGFLADTGPAGSHCHVEERSASGTWQSAAGYPAAFATGYKFGLVQNQVVTVSSTRTGVSYLPQLTAAPDVITTTPSTAALAQGNLTAPVVLISDASGALGVVRQR